MPSLLIRLCCLLLIVSFHDGVAAVDEDEFIYNGFAGGHLLEAYVTQDGALALTTSWSHDIEGHGFHPKALPFVSSDGVAITSFSATFVFAITPDDSVYSGDGMAFVISTLAPLSFDSPGQYLGLSNYDDAPAWANPFFAIELDTVVNTEFGDIDDNHVGIDLNNLTSARSSTAGFHSGSDGKGFNPLRLSSGKPMQVWVDYFKEQVEVRLAPVTWYKPISPLLTYHSVDLAKVLKNGTKSKAGVPTMAYVGFSATTGDMPGGGGGANLTHQVLGWSFSMSGSAKPLNLSLVLLQSQQVRDSSRVQDAHDKKKLVKWLPAVVSSIAILAGIPFFLEQST